MSIGLGKIGIWRHPSGLTPELLAEVEALGYGAIWVGGSPAGDLAVVENILDATDHIAVATGILNVWKDDAAIQVLNPDPRPALQALSNQLQLPRAAPS